MFLLRRDVLAGAVPCDQVDAVPARAGAVSAAERCAPCVAGNERSNEEAERDLGEQTGPLFESKRYVLKKFLTVTKLVNVVNVEKFLPWLQVRLLEWDPISAMTSDTIVHAAEAISMLLVNGVLEDDKMSYLTMLPMCLVSLINLELTFKEHSYVWKKP